MTKAFSFLAGAALVAAGAAATPAAAVVIDFENAAEGPLTTYAGVNWGSRWYNYGVTQSPYNPHSGVNRIFANYDVTGFGVSAVAFTFGTGVVFNGAWFAGSANAERGVSFQLYRSGVQVATSGLLTTSATSTYLESGYGGLVDEVRVLGDNGFYVMDDVTYAAAPPAAVPEPATWGMMLLGFGMAGYGLRRRRAAVRTAVRFA